MNKEIVCVAGATGLVGANIVKAALSHGYHVHGTLRDLSDSVKTNSLQALTNAQAGLTLFEADMTAPDSFNAAMKGADCLFIACLIPIYVGPSGKRATEMDDEQGYAEIIMPTVDGCLNLMRTALSNDVKNIIICSSTSSTNPPTPVALKNETEHWSDETIQCAAKKYTSAAKTVMEKAAMSFAEDNGQRLSILLPTLMLGPAVIPGQDDEGFQGSIKKMLQGGPPRYAQIPNSSISMIHVQDLAELFIAAYENPNASGRYFGVYDSWHLQDIFAELAKLMPGAEMPKPIADEPVEPTGFDTTRRDSLGVAVRDIPTLLRDVVELYRTDG